MVESEQRSTVGWAWSEETAWWWGWEGREEAGGAVRKHCSHPGERRCRLIGGVHSAVWVARGGRIWVEPAGHGGVGGQSDRAGEVEKGGTQVSGLAHEDGDAVAEMGSPGRGAGHTWKQMQHRQ